MPYLAKGTLKCLGEGIDQLSERLITNQGIDLNEAGQEVSQIAFLSESTYIEDIRLLQTYDQMNLQ